MSRDLWSGVVLGLGVVVLGLATSVPGAGPAGAQPLPPSADPSRLDQRLAEPPRPRSTAPLVLEGPDDAPPPAQARAIRFAVTAVRVEGADRIPAADLEALTAPLADREASLLEIYELRDALTARYRAAGYALSQAIVPAQRVENGVVRVTVIAGFISGVTFEGATSPETEAILAPYVAPILAERPIRAATLERQLLLMDDLPGLAVRSVLRPDEQVVGGTLLALVVERTPVSAGLTVDNRGSAAIGPWQTDLSAEANLPAHRLALRAMAARPTDEMMLGDVAWTGALGDAGTTATAGLRRSLSKPGGAGRLALVHSDTRSLRLGLSHPLMRSSAETLRLSAEASVRDSRTHQFYGTPDQRLQSADRLGALSATAAWDAADGWGGANVVQATLSHGFGLPGGVDGAPRSRADGVVAFRKATLYAQRDQPLGDGLALTVAAEAQWSPDALLSSEEYGVGGKSFGLAYDSSEISGDRGGALRLELSWAMRPGGDEGPFVQPYAYVDGGGVANRGGAGQRPGWQSLYSAGLGARLAHGPVSAGLLVARPLSETGTGTDGARPWRTFLTFSARF